MTFEYTTDPICEHEDFVLKVPANIVSKADLLAAFASAGHFPAYFGNNWDALLDFLRDLSWISNRRVLIVHDDLPLNESPEYCRTYLEVLQTAQSDWKMSVKPDVIWHPDLHTYVEHELQVYFSPAARSTIESLMAKLE